MDDNYTSGKYKRVFGGLVEDEEDDEDELDPSIYLRNKKKKSKKKRAGEDGSDEDKREAEEIARASYRRSVKAQEEDSDEEDPDEDASGKRLDEEKQKAIQLQKKKAELKEKEEAEAESLKERYASSFGQQTGSTAYGTGLGTDETMSEETSPEKKRWFKSLIKDELKQKEGSKEKESSQTKEGATEYGKTTSSGTLSLNGKSKSSKNTSSGREEGGRSQDRGKNEEGASTPDMGKSFGKSTTECNTVSNSFRVQSKQAEEEGANNAQAAKDSAGGSNAYSGVFNIASEELDDKKNFIKGKTKFARTLGDGDQSGDEVAVESVKETGRTFFQLIKHMATQVKNVVAIIVTMVFGPIAGMIVSMIGSILNLLLIVSIAVVVIVAAAVTAVVTFVTTIVTCIAGFLVDDFNNTSAMYQYADNYSIEYVEELEEEVNSHDTVVFYDDERVTRETEFTISLDDIYLLYLGINEEAEYANSDLELTDDSDESILEELLEDTDENKALFEELFSEMYYYEEEGEILNVYFMSPDYYIYNYESNNGNIICLGVAAETSSEMRDKLGMMQEPVEISYPWEGK